MRVLASSRAQHMYQHIKAFLSTQQCIEGSEMVPGYEITMQLLLGYCTGYSEVPGRKLCILKLCNPGGPAARYHSQRPDCSLSALVQQGSMSSGTSTPVAGPLVNIDARQDLNGCGSCGSVDMVTRVPCNQKLLYSIASCCASFPTWWLADARAQLLVSPDSSRHRSETSR